MKSSFTLIQTAVLILALMIGSWIGLTHTLVAAETVPAAESRLVVLNKNTMLRYRMAYKTPEMINASGALSVPVEGKKAEPMNSYESTFPDAAWMGSKFDDTGWSRGVTPVEVPAGGRLYRAFEAQTGYRLYARL